jgi:hypothetical protein
MCIQIDLVIWDLFISANSSICDWKLNIFSGTYTYIYSHSWSFYMRICHIRAQFFLLHITRSTCIRKFTILFTFLLFLSLVLPYFPFLEISYNDWSINQCYSQCTFGIHDLRMPRIVFSPNCLQSDLYHLVNFICFIASIMEYPALILSCLNHLSVIKRFTVVQIIIIGKNRV